MPEKKVKLFLKIDFERIFGYNAISLNKNDSVFCIIMVYNRTDLCQLNWKEVYEWQK